MRWQWGTKASTWHDCMPPRPHYHANTALAVVCLEGSCDVAVGRDNHTTLGLNAGDVLLLPPGLWRSNAGQTDDAKVMGVYHKDMPMWVFETEDIVTMDVFERINVMSNKFLQVRALVLLLLRYYCCHAAVATAPPPILRTHSLTHLLSAGGSPRPGHRPPPHLVVRQGPQADRLARRERL